MNDKYKNILKLFGNRFDSETQKIIAYTIVLKFFLDKETFFEIFNEYSNSDFRKIIYDLAEKERVFFDNTDIRDGLVELSSNFIIKYKNNYEIKDFIKIIGNTELTSLIEFYNYFLEQLSLKPFNSGLTFSPKEINKLAKDILNPTNLTFYSPTFGVGKDFVDTFGKDISKFSFFGQEINNITFLLSKIYLKINNINGEIRQGGFAEDMFNKGETFDYSFSIPPFGIKDEGIERAGLIEGRQRNSDYFFIDKVLKHLNENGRGIIVLPFSSVFKKSNNAIQERKRLLNLGLESIIILPKNSFKLYTSIDTVLWIFNKRKIDKKVLFIDGRFSSIKEIYNAYNTKNEIDGISKFSNYSEIDDNDFNLNPGIYVNGLIEEIKILEKNEEKIQRLPKVKRFTDIEVPKEILDGMPKEIQELMIKGKREGKISQDKIMSALPNAEDDLDFLDEMYTRFLKLDIKIVDNLDKENLFLNIPLNEKNEQKENFKEQVYSNSYQKVKFENDVQKDTEEYVEDLKDKENKQQSKNLDNITDLNDKIHEDIKNFSKTFEIYPLDLKDEIWKNWNKRTKDSMRLANIISLNSYIYNKDENIKIEKQFELVKYFDDQLDKEWKLEAKKEYAKKLLIILIIETCLLFVISGILFYKFEIKELNQISDLLKWTFGLTLGQITVMVGTIVIYLFPNGEKNDGK